MNAYPSFESPSDDLRGMPAAGDVFDGKYRIDGLLGTGGMALVLAATHLHLDERVAIKMLLPRWSQDRTLVDRFMREGRAAIKIHSEHVVRVLDVGIAEGRPYLVMEFLDGRDLDSLVRAEGALPIARAVDFVLQAMEAIAEAHASGTIHRDLKPANLFLTRRPDGSPCVKVLDFGISKVTTAPTSDSRTTMPTAVMGSPHYMSPEQMQSSKNVDVRADIWSLGAILHELLAGRPPFEADSITALCARILKESPPPIVTIRRDVPPALEAVILRCLEKEPSRRYANVAELARALAGFGSRDAYASAERIGRIVEGGIGVEGVPWSLPPEPMGVSRPAVPVAAPLRAMTLFDESMASVVPMRRPIFGYVVGLGVLAAIGGAFGWTVWQHERALQAAQARTTAALVRRTLPSDSSTIPPPPANAASTVAAPVAAPNAAPPPSPVATPAPSPSTAPPKPAASPAPPPSAPHPAIAKPIPTKAPRPHQAPHPHRTVVAPESDFAPPASPPAFDVANDRYAAPASSPSLTPAPSTTTATPPPEPPPTPSADPSQLFDDRK